MFHTCWRGTRGAGRTRDRHHRWRGGYGAKFPILPCAATQCLSPTAPLQPAARSPLPLLAIHRIGGRYGIQARSGQESVSRDARSHQNLGGLATHDPKRPFTFDDSLADPYALRDLCWLTRTRRGAIPPSASSVRAGRAPAATTRRRPAASSPRPPPPAARSARPGRSRCAA